MVFLITEMLCLKYKNNLVKNRKKLKKFWKKDKKLNKNILFWGEQRYSMDYLNTEYKEKSKI